MSKYSIF